jgi:hypothetical protein
MKIGYVAIIGMTQILLCSSSFAQQPDFAGKYAGKAGGYSWSADIAARKDGKYDVEIDVGSRQPACSGDLTTVGEIRGGKLVTQPPEKDDKCVVTISRNGNGISVSEGDCTMWHGASCSFDSKMSKRR